MNAIIKKIIISLVFILPFVFFSGLYYPAVFSKSLFIETAALIIGTLWLISKLSKKETNTIPKNIVFLSFSIYILTILISCLNGVAPGLSFWGTMDRGVGIIFMLCLFTFSLVVSSIFKTKEDWLKLFTAFTLSGVIFTIGTFLSVAGVKFSSDFKLDILSGFTIGNSSYAGIYLSFVFFISLGVFLSSKIKFQKIFGILGMLSVILNPIITGFIIPGNKLVGEARTTFYSIVIGLVIFCIYLIFKKIYSPVWRKVFIGFFIVIFTSGILFISFYKPNPIRQFVSDNAGPSRLIFWDIAVDGFKEKPILGWGNDTYHLVYAKYFNPIITTDGYSKEYWVDRSHNIFLDELVSSGIFGFISLVFLYGILLFGLARSAIRNKENFLFISIFAGLVSFLVQGMMIFQVVIGWFIVAIIIAFVSNLSFKDKILNHKPKLDYTKYKSFMIPTLIILCCIGLIYIVFKPYSISYKLAHFPAMKIDQRILAYDKIDNSHVGNTADLGSAFLPFFANVQNSLSAQKLNDNDKKVVKGEMDKIVNVLGNGLKRESYMDMKLLMSTLGFYSILVSLTDGQEKDSYYEKGLYYVDRMFEVSPQNPINKISKDMIDFSYKNNLANLQIPNLPARR